MKHKATAQWPEATKRRNTGKTLKVGDTVSCRFNGLGVVTDIDVPDNPDDEDHGSVTVRLDAGYDEHYVYHGWESLLRIQEQ